MNKDLIFPYLGNVRHMTFGKFEIPEYTVPAIQFDSINRIAAFNHTKYEHGAMHVHISEDEALQKIQVHDLVFAFWGPWYDITLSAYHQTLKYLEDLEDTITRYNEFTSDKLVVVTTVFYSDNPIYDPNTKVRYLVARISRLDDFKERT